MDGMKAASAPTAVGTATETDETVATASEQEASENGSDPRGERYESGRYLSREAASKGGERW